MKRHREIKVPDEPFVDWERKRYTGPKENLSPPDHAELETDRDLGKPVAQLLCDVYEGYTYWLRLKNSPDTPEEMKTPIELILYSMVRTASMNAVVARESAALQKSVEKLTCWIWILTVILVFLGIAQLWIQFRSSGVQSPVAEVSENLKRDVKPSPRLSQDESRKENPSNNRLEQMAGRRSNSEGSRTLTTSAGSGGDKPSLPATAQP
jgi:hypothetical protein